MKEAAPNMKVFKSRFRDIAFAGVWAKRQVC